MRFFNSKALSFTNDDIKNIYYDEITSKITDAQLKHETFDNYIDNTLFHDEKDNHSIHFVIEQNKPNKRFSSALNVLDNKMYVHGGSDMEVLNDTWSFDLKDNYWELLDDGHSKISPPPAKNRISSMYNNKLIIKR